MLEACVAAAKQHVASSVSSETLRRLAMSVKLLKGKTRFDEELSDIRDNIQGARQELVVTSHTKPFT